MKLSISTKKYDRLLLIPLLVLHFSCSKPVDFVPSAKTQIYVDASGIAEMVDVSALIKEISIIPIIEAEDALLGEVEKVFLTEDHYLLFDLFSSNRIVAFDKNGNFVKDVISKGEGPGELLRISDAWLNGEGHLEAYDRGLQKILIYDNNYEVIDAIHIEGGHSYISLAKFPHHNAHTGFLGYHGIHDDGMYHKIAILDSVRNPVNLTFPYHNSLYNALVSVPLNPFFIIDDTLRFSQNFDPIIYNIAPTGEVTREFELVYAPHPLPKDFEGQLVQENLNLFTTENPDYDAIRSLFSGYTGYSGKWWETENYVIFDSFGIHNNRFLSIYHKKSDADLIQGNFFTESSKYHMHLPTHIHTTDVDENRFISAIQGYYLIETLKEESPFYELVNQDLESFYIIEVKFK